MRVNKAWINAVEVDLIPNYSVYVCASGQWYVCSLDYVNLEAARNAMAAQIGKTTEELQNDPTCFWFPIPNDPRSEGAYHV